MTTDKSSEREAFEAWAREAGYCLGTFGDRRPNGALPNEDYYDSRTWAAWNAWQARAALPQQAQDDVGLPPRYMLAKLQLVVPVLQEARDALTAITEAQRKLHGISASLADRMDEAGTFSLDDWYAAIAKGERHE